MSGLTKPKIIIPVRAKTQEEQDIAYQISRLQTKLTETEQKTSKADEDFSVSTKKLAQVHSDIKNKAKEHTDLLGYFSETTLAVKDATDELMKLNIDKKSIQGDIVSLTQQQEKQIRDHDIEFSRKSQISKTQLQNTNEDLSIARKSLIDINAKISDLSIKHEIAAANHADILGKTTVVQKEHDILLKKKEETEGVLRSHSISNTNLILVNTELETKIIGKKTEIKTLQDSIDLLKKQEDSIVESRKSEQEDIDTQKFDLVLREKSLEQKKNFIKTMYLKAGVTWKE